MSTYKEINGTGIEVLSTDPSNPQDGQVWYRSDLGTFKTQKESTIGAYSTAANYPVTASNIRGDGTQTAAIFNGGQSYGQTSNTYNGTSYSSIPNSLNERQRHAVMGTDTAALATGGVPISADTELWNGTSWTEVNNTNTARDALGRSGVSTSALIYAGGLPSTPPTPARNLTESWNGTNWTEVADLSTPRNRTAGAGTSNTSAICFGGHDPLRGSPPTEETTNNTESWNGTSWTTLNPMNTWRYYLSGSGTATSAIAAGGEIPSQNLFGPESPTNRTEVYDGTSWTTSATLITGRYRHGSAGGSNSSGLVVNGEGPLGGINTTEEFNSPTSVTESITLE
jgi:hypothetical protein